MVLETDVNTLLLPQPVQRTVALLGPELEETERELRAFAEAAWKHPMPPAATVSNLPEARAVSLVSTKVMVGMALPAPTAQVVLAHHMVHWRAFSLLRMCGACRVCTCDRGMPGQASNSAGKRLLQMKQVGHAFPDF